MHHYRHDFCAAPDESFLPHLILLSSFERSTVVPVLRVSTSLRLLQVVLASLTVASCLNGEQP